MWNEEGGDGEHRVVPSEPDLVRQHCRLSICENWLSWTSTVSEQKIPITILILKRGPCLDLVGSIPGQGVQVVHEHRLLQVLPHQLVKKMECLHVSRTDKASARHFKAVEGGLVGRDVSQKVRVFVCFFLVPCFDVAHAGHCKFVNVQCFSVF